MTDWTRRYGCDVASGDGDWLVAPKGEVDVAAAPLLAAALRVVVPHRAVVDLRAVTFLDTAAVDALLSAEASPVLARPSAVAREALARCGAAHLIVEQSPLAGEAMQPHALIATDRDGRITDWNDAALELFGWQPWEALGRPIATVGVCPPDEALAREITLAVRRGEVWGGEFEVLHRSGATVRARVRELLLHDVAGSEAGLLRLCAPAAASAAAERSPLPM